MNAKVTREQFLQAFSDQWDKELETREAEVNDLYASARPWTNFMLQNGEFIDKVIQSLGLGLVRKPEWWKIDLVYTSNDSAAAHRNGGYPMKLPLLIEHENGDFPEEEMYNLIFFRAPLKVVIFRDYNDSDRVERNRGWCEGKLALFGEMLEAANDFHPEAPSTQYLFISWARKETGAVYWRWASDVCLEPKEWDRTAT